MIDKEKVIKALELEIKYGDTWQCALDCPYYGNTECTCYKQVAMDALELLKEQELHELTKNEWEQWKKNPRRDPICMLWYKDTTPMWTLTPVEVHEPAYLMGKIKLFNRKPTAEEIQEVKWDE